MNVAELRGQLRKSDCRMKITDEKFQAIERQLCAAVREIFKAIEACDAEESEAASDALCSAQGTIEAVALTLQGS